MFYWRTDLSLSLYPYVLAKPLLEATGHVSNQVLPNSHGIQNHLSRLIQYAWWLGGGHQGLTSTGPGLRWSHTPQLVKQSIAATFYGYYQNLFAASLRQTALRLTASFGSTYICEEAFSKMKIIKSRFRSRLTDEHLKYCLHLCLSNYEPSFSNLSLDMQCHASTAQ
jgi:hypothetical protein